VCVSRFVYLGVYLGEQIGLPGLSLPSDMLLLLVDK
jgi:hypothetical protein